MSPLRGFSVELCRLPRACARGFTISAPPGRFERHHDSSGFGICSLRRVSEKTLKILITRSKFKAKIAKLELKKHLTIKTQCTHTYGVFCYSPVELSFPCRRRHLHPLHIGEVSHGKQAGCTQSERAIIVMMPVSMMSNPASTGGRLLQKQ